MALQKSTITIHGEIFDYWTLKEVEVVKNDDDTFTYNAVLKLYKNKAQSKKALEPFQRAKVSFLNGSFGLNQSQIYTKIKEDPNWIDATDILNDTN